MNEICSNKWEDKFIWCQKTGKNHDDYTCDDDPLNRATGVIYVENSLFAIILMFILVSIFFVSMFISPMFISYHDGPDTILLDWKRVKVKA